MKVCGVTQLEQVGALEELGVDALGINLHPPSPRSVDPERAAELCAAARVPTVLVVVDRPELELAELWDHAL